MTPIALAAERRRAEWELLRALCAAPWTPAEQHEVVVRLTGYQFTDPVRQAIFDEVGKMGRERKEILRQELPARLTRRGFPHADFAALFVPSSFTAAQALAMAARLLGAAEPAPAASVDSSVPGAKPRD